MSPPRAREREFARYLQRFVDHEERAPLAALRRGLGKSLGEAAEMHRYVMPFLPGESRWGEEEAYYLVAALFAFHQGSWPADEGEAMPAATNLGASFAWLARARRTGDAGADEQGGVEGSRGGGDESIERRFVALLNCRRDDLPDHLRHGVGLLKAHAIPVDWAQLLRDLQEWEWERRSVQRAWARAFWRRPRRAAIGDPIGDDAGADNGQSNE